MGSKWSKMRKNSEKASLGMSKSSSLVITPFYSIHVNISTVTFILYDKISHSWLKLTQESNHYLIMHINKRHFCHQIWDRNYRKIWVKFTKSVKGQIRARDPLCKVLLPVYIYCVDNNHQLDTVFTLYMPLLPVQFIWKNVNASRRSFSRQPFVPFGDFREFGDRQAWQLHCKSMYKLVSWHLQHWCQNPRLENLTFATILPVLPTSHFVCTQVCHKSLGNPCPPLPYSRGYTCLFLDLKLPPLSREIHLIFTPFYRLFNGFWTPYVGRVSLETCPGHVPARRQGTGARIWTLF
jgi:hypothetical protein